MIKHWHKINDNQWGSRIHLVVAANQLLSFKYPCSTPMNFAMIWQNCLQLFPVTSYLELWNPLSFRAKSMICCNPWLVSPMYLVYPGGLYLFTVTLFVEADDLLDELLPETPWAPPAAYSKQYQPSWHLIEIPKWLNMPGPMNRLTWWTIE